MLARASATVFPWTAIPSVTVGLAQELGVVVADVAHAADRVGLL